MLGLGKTRPFGAPATASQAIYQRHAAALYRQARCQQLTAGPARQDRRRPQRSSLSVARCIDPGGILSEQERGALGLVLCGGLGYVQASTVLGIGPDDMAALLRTTMHTLAISSAIGNGDQA